MWAYVIYLAVDAHIYRIFGMLVPWLLIFGYLKSSSKWDYAAVVAACTPAMINLGRLPYRDILPAGDFAILRIEENLVGIAVAVVLTIVIFPVFAIDLLRNNIQSKDCSLGILSNRSNFSFHMSTETIQLCRLTGESMRPIYDRLFHQDDSNTETDTDLEKNDPPKIQSVVSTQRGNFHRLIGAQRVLLDYASLEPAICWSRNKFCPELYTKLASQQTDIFQMLHNIDTIVS